MQVSDYFTDTTPSLKGSAQLFSFPNKKTLFERLFEKRSPGVAIHGIVIKETYREYNHGS